MTKKNISRFIYSDDYSYIEYNDQYIIVINNDALSNVGNQHNALIIQKKNKYKYFIIYDNNEPFELLNPCPGNISYSGCISALRFCDLIYYLKQKQWEDASKYSSSWVKDSSFQDRVYFIDDENFNKLVKGEIYVEEIFNNYHSDDNGLIYMLFENNVKESDNRISQKHKEWFFELKNMIDRMSKRWGREWVDLKNE